MFPKILNDLVNELKTLPGVGKKQAEKIAYHIVSSDSFISENLIDTIKIAIGSIKKCQTCNHLTADDVCQICLDKTRQKVLVVVESPLDVFKLEAAKKQLRPYYFVLGSLINPKKDDQIGSPNIAKLTKYAQEFNEVILALSPNLQGIVTANYLRTLLKNSKVTQLAQGIPLGAAMEYVDGLTLETAFANRKEID